MNDFDYDVLQKKRIARNAKYQKKGSRSKGCRLPDDYLSRAEKAKLSETKVSIKLRSPITLEEFTACSTPLKREWLEWVRDEFNAGGATISHDLWGKDRTWLIQYLKRHEPTLTDIFADHRRQKYDIRERWLAWCAGEQTVEKKNANEQEPPEQEPPENMVNPNPAPTPEQKPLTRVTSGAFTVSGTADEALELLRMMFRGDHHTGTFTLTFAYDEEDANGLA